MSWLPVQTVAQMSVERILNALPEGFLIALFAWAMLRVLRRQNSGTRFAVWFLALLAVAALPLLGGFGAGRALMAAGMSSGMSVGGGRPAITIPGRWALFAFLAWTLGASAAMVRLAVGLWRLRRLRRSCMALVAADLDPAVRKTVDAISASGSFASRSITVATSEYVRVPAAIGFWKRIIVLPAWTLRELPPNDLNVILLHEFAHLRRWDDWTNLIQKIVRALFFFHPAVWWIENRLSVDRELAYDKAVMAETANPHGYASCLVSLLEKSLGGGDGRWPRQRCTEPTRPRCGSRRFSTRTGPWPRESGNRRSAWLERFLWFASRCCRTRHSSSRLIAAHRQVVLSMCTRLRSASLRPARCRPLVESRASPAGWTLRLRSGQARETPVVPLPIRMRSPDASLLRLGRLTPD